MSEETPKEFAPRGTADCAATTAFSQCRLLHTALWTKLHGCESSADICGQPEKDAVLDEFAIELMGFCCEENDLLHRMRTLRFTRQGLASFIRKRRHHGAGKKCARTSIG